MATRNEYDVSRLGFVVDPNSIVKNFGRKINWDGVVDVDAKGNKQIIGGAFVSQKGGGVVPRKDAEVAITALTEDGAGTATATAAGHGYQVGDKITITGAAVADYNGDWVVASVPTDDTFTFDGVTGTPADDNGGATSISKAIGILYEGINEAERERNLAGQAILIGGVIYENLLPDSGDSDFDSFKSEANSAGNGFTWETYSDNRVS